MNNDFDFIKDKIENSGVKAPEDMDESFVLGAISDTQPKVVPIKNKRKGLVVAVSAAAAVLVLTIALSVMFKAMSDNKNKLKALQDESGLIRYQTRDEVKAAVKSVLKEQKKGDDLAIAFGREYMAADEYSAAADSGVSANGAAASASSSHSETYKQVEGVDEADIIKTDGRYIYCVDKYGDEITVFSAEGDASRKVAQINVNDGTDAATRDEPDERVYYDYYSNGMRVSEIYLRGDRLIALCDRIDADSRNVYAQVYDISDIPNITLLDTMTQSGDYISSRMIGNTLYTVSTYYTFDEDDLPVCGDTAEPEEIRADCICSIARPVDSSFMVVSAYDTVDFASQTESRAVFGGATDIYCNLNNLYAYTTEWDYGDAPQGGFFGVFNGSEGSFYNENATVTTDILKIDLTDGLSFSAFDKVDGQVNSQYSFDESDGNLRVATTSYADGRDTNNLFVLDGDLNVIGSVTDFAKNESIKAVRYVGDTAYVITYEQTDPLFVIDLSTPTSPEILGEVKITGFSTMLVPVDENTVLGLGYQTEEEDYTYLEVQEGFKLALFDVSDKTAPKVLDSVSFVDCYSEVMYEPKALVYNPDRNDYIVPLNYMHYGTADYNYGDAGYDSNDVSEFYGGMLNFKVEDGRIVVNEHYRSDNTDNIERCIYVGDTIYMTYHDGSGISSIALETTQYK